MNFGEHRRWLLYESLKKMKAKNSKLLPIAERLYTKTAEVEKLLFEYWTELDLVEDGRAYSEDDEFIIFLKEFFVYLEAICDSIEYGNEINESDDGSFDINTIYFN